MQGLSQNLFKPKVNLEKLNESLFKLKILLSKLKRLLELFMIFLMILLPTLSYSQSKNQKYPKQTVFNGDTVVILSLSQAVEMNESFLEMQSKIDSINSVADTLKSVVILKQYEAQNFEWQFNKATRELDKRYIRQHRLEVGKDIVLCLSVVTGFVFVTDWLNQQ